jgi:Protein of unknown function (DUF3826)
MFHSICQIRQSELASQGLPAKFFWKNLSATAIMKKNLFTITLALAALVPYAQFTFAEETNSVAETEAKYTAAIVGRTADILKLLDLSDTNKISKVHDVIISQYRALNVWHSENDAKLKMQKSDTNAVAQIHASLKNLHDSFLSHLAQNLSPEQIEKVKDKMTYGKVQFTYNGFAVSKFVG